MALETEIITAGAIATAIIALDRVIKGILTFFGVDGDKKRIETMDKRIQMLESELLKERHEHH